MTDHGRENHRSHTASPESHRARSTFEHAPEVGPRPPRASASDCRRAILAAGLFQAASRRERGSLQEPEGLRAQKEKGGPGKPDPPRASRAYGTKWRAPE